MQQNGHISEVQGEILRYWYRMLNKNKLINLNIDLHIYVKAPVNIALDRIAFRNRTGEQHLTEQHATQLESAHKSWLLQSDSDVFYTDHHSEVFVMNRAKTGREITKEYLKAIEWIRLKKIQRDGVWLQHEVD